MPSLPAATQPDEGAHIAESLRVELSLGAKIERFASGSVPVFAVGDEHVVKLFPATEAAFFETEKAALTRIEGRLPIPTPRVIAAGERGAWLYVVMTRLRGRSMAEAWPMIGVEGRHALMREVGATLAALRAIPTGDLAPLAVDWPRFVDQQRASCRDRQLGKGLGAHWLDLLGDFLAKWTPQDDGSRVLLHTEIMREHLLVAPGKDGFRVSGLIDFEPAMVGAPEYDLASIGVFVTCAEPGLLRSLLDACGAKADDELPLRIMVYALLHRYSNLRWYLERLGGADAESDLESLARSWFTP